MGERLSIRDFADHQCERHVFSKRKWPPSKRSDWCSWCRAFLAGNDDCPIKVALQAPTSAPTAG